MLTSQDLSSIKNLIDESLDSKLDKRFDEFGKEIDSKLDKRFDEFEIKLDTKLEKKFDEKLKPVHKKLNRLQKDLSATIDFYDDHDIQNRKRIEHLEHRLGITNPNSL